MTPRQINKNIARLCGWINIDSLQYGCTESNQRDRRIPNYYNDLNAIHDATMMLLKPLLTKDHDLWFCEIEGVCRRDNGGKYPYEFDFANATAPQRCEALLRTLGKWEE